MGCTKTKRLFPIVPQDLFLNFIFYLFVAGMQKYNFFLILTLTWGRLKFTFNPKSLYVDFSVYTIILSQAVLASPWFWASPGSLPLGVDFPLAKWLALISKSLLPLPQSLSSVHCFCQLPTSPVTPRTLHCPFSSGPSCCLWEELILELLLGWTQEGHPRVM